MNRARQHGATLAELTVALSLGLLVLLLASALLISANAAYLTQAESAGVDDGGRYVLEAITRSVRQAAFLNWERDESGIGVAPGAPARIGGLDDRTLNRSSEGISDPLPDAVNASDVLAVRFGGAGASPDGDGSVTNCAGFGVSELEDGWSIFYVARNAEGEAELRCKYRGRSGWGSDAIASGVDTFQVLYGLDTDAPPDGVANEFVTATAIDALDAALVLEGDDEAARAIDRLRKTHWKRIASVKVALLLHGARQSRTDGAATVFDLFGGAYGRGPGAADRGTRIDEARLPAVLRARERRVFTATILLRNPAL